MTLRQHLAVILLLALAACLAGSLALLAGRAEAIAAEGRRLLSPDAVAVRASAEEVFRHESTFVPGSRAFREIPDLSRTRAVVVLNGDWTDVAASTGIRVTEPTARGALVGSGIETDRSGGAAHIEVAGRKYTVIGSLGLRAASLLAEDVLVADPQAFRAAAANRERIVLDGPDVRARAVAAFGGERVEVVQAGANRRTNVDFVTPIVVALGFAVAAMAAGVAGMSAARHEMQRLRIRTLIGRDTRSASGRVALVVITDAGVALSCAVLVLAAPSAAGSVAVAAPILVPALVFVLSTCVPVMLGRRSWS